MEDTISAWDPGIEGGHALLSQDRKILGLSKMPRIGSEWDIWKIADMMRPAHQVVIEHVNAGAVKGRLSAFSFGNGFGILQGVAIGLGKQIRLVRPKVWQDEMLKGIKGGDTKARARVAAMRIWPSEVAMLRTFKDGPIDALLIALWANRNP